MSDRDDKSKLLIDEDWKSQVQAEKEAAKAVGQSTAPPTVAPGGSSVRNSASGSPPESGSPQSKLADSAPLDDALLPPPTLALLCTTLATPAMIALGQIPNPLTGKFEVRLNRAKHFIDTLGMLEEKTAGNRTAEETALFSDLLHQLRLAFVMTRDDKSASIH